MPESSAETCLAFRDLTLGYASHPAVHHLSGELARGALTAIVGPNGSGKSTLLKGIAGLIAPMSGACSIAPDTRIAYLPQQSELDRHFPARVVDLVSMGLWPRRGLLGRHTADDRSKISEALDAVGLAEFATRPIDTLSGGQLQRALFARVMVQDADLILLDEPFNAVDHHTIRALLALIERWHGERRTVLVVAHDLDIVRAHFPETLLLAREPVAWGPTAEVLTRDKLRKAQHFHEAWRDDAPWCEPADGSSSGHAHDHDHNEHGHTHAHTPEPAPAKGAGSEAA